MRIKCLRHLPRRKEGFRFTAEESKTVKASFISGRVITVFSHHCGKMSNTNNLEREERSYFGSWFWGFSPWPLSHMCLGRIPWCWEWVAKILLHVTVNRMKKEGGDTGSTSGSPFFLFCLNPQLREWCYLIGQVFPTQITLPGNILHRNTQNHSSTTS